jgi:hypothetical protein
LRRRTTTSFLWPASHGSFRSRQSSDRSRQSSDRILLYWFVQPRAATIGSYDKSAQPPRNRRWLMAANSICILQRITVIAARGRMGVHMHPNTALGPGRALNEKGDRRDRPDRRQLLGTAAMGTLSRAPRACFPHFWTQQATHRPTFEPGRYANGTQRTRSAFLNQFSGRGLSTCAGASTRQNGLSRNRSPMRRRACSLQRSQKLARRWATDYDWRKVEACSTPCRSSLPRSMDSTFISFTLVPT